MKKVPLQEGKITWLDFLLSERCNLKCVYCFHKQRPLDMTEETMQATVDFLAPYFSEDITFNFFGGEPLLQLDLFIRWVKKLKLMYPKCKFHVNTNGTVYTDELADLCSNHHMLQLSYDGAQQGTQRGQQELVERNLKKFLEKCTAEKVVVRLTFTRSSVSSLFNNVKRVYELGVRQFAHHAEYSNDWTEEELHEYNRQLDKIHEFIKDKPDFYNFFCDCHSILKNVDVVRSCAMGDTLVSVAANGDIFPCHRSIAFPKFKIGNVFERKFNRGKFAVLAINKCMSCEARAGCHSCFIANYQYNGSLEEPVKAACSMNIYEYKKKLEKFGEVYDITKTEASMLIAIDVVLQDVGKTNNDTVEALR